MTSTLPCILRRMTLVIQQVGIYKVEVFPCYCGPARYEYQWVINNTI